MEDSAFTTVRQLRLAQGICIVLASSCIWLIGRTRSASHLEMRAIHWAIILVAIYCAAVGFTMQRKLTKGPSQSRQPKTSSTPVTRWRAGHLFRLYTALSVALWGAVLSIYKRPLYLAYSLAALSLFLLVIWRPGVRPDPQTISVSK